ncbi:MAG: ATP-binding cassette, subfamily bacterial [Acidobacteriota bacterium]|jgi:subfamily B ATP-binding cassette protein MsbA|nr:ATP-binding cassette, subfamily bacterial [Acidobacteriota bacterium]MDT5261646.1 ATP-binding cassette, subfamily bacterial [Acidobacteriota bacterium]
MSASKIKITRLLRPYRGQLAVAFLAIVAESATDLLEPWPLKIVFDYVFGQKQMPGWMKGLLGRTVGLDKLAVLNFAAAAVIIIAVVGALSTYAEKYLTTSVGQHVMHDLRLTLYNHIQRLSLSFFAEQKTGDLIVRMTSDIDAVQDFVSSALLGILVSFLTLVGMLGVMFYLNWRFTLISLSVAPALFFVVYSFTRRIKHAARAVKKKEGEIASVVQESLSAVRLIRAFAREDFESRRLDEKSLESVEMALLARGVKAKLAPFVELIVAAGTCLVIWYGARLVLAGEISSGALIVFILYLGKMYKPMRELSKMTDTISKASVGFERIREVLETESKVRDLPRARRAPRFRGGVEFEGVSFSYGPEQPILKDISLTVEPGEFVALVGPTGSGKSTLISLIPRFYDPTSGRVKIDGADVRSFRLKSLRDQISYVLQESFLFRATLWENIAYGKPGATRAEIVRAARLANAHEFIEQLPEGYNTVVGERGETLSGGQRQRVTIARAVIRETPILLLDEPSSGLDAESEELVFEALGRLMENKTSIVIAHRLATVMRASRIFAVEDGSIVESGTHAELLERGGLYSRLHEIQFKEQTPPDASAESDLSEGKVNG